MGIYVKKEIQVEAIQFTDKTKDSVYNWAKSIQGNVYHDWDENTLPILKIPTLEGEMICSLNDYIIVEPFPTVLRKLYPCKESIFNETYRLVTELPQNLSLSELKNLLHEVSLLIAGWNATEVEWSLWDKQVNSKVSQLRLKLEDKKEVIFK